MAVKPKTPWDKGPLQTETDFIESVAVEIDADGSETETLSNDSSESETIADDHAVIQNRVNKDLITVTVPKDFKLTLDDHSVINYKHGIQPMKRSHAEHWWAVQNGVEIYDGEIPTTQDERLTFIKQEIVSKFSKLSDDKKDAFIEALDSAVKSWR